MRGSFPAPNCVFFHSGVGLVYCAAVSIQFSAGLICHPIKKKPDSTGTLGVGVSELVFSKRWGGDEREGKARHIRP